MYYCKINKIVQWFTLFTHVPYCFCPSVSFCPPPPWKSCNDLRYLPMSRIILPPYHFGPPGSFNVHYFPMSVSFCPHINLPLSFCPLKLFHDLHLVYLPMFSIILPPGLILPPIIFAPWKWFNDLHYLPMSCIILPPAFDFVCILIKSPLQQKLMTGAHLVTVAPLVVEGCIEICHCQQNSHFPYVWWRQILNKRILSHINTLKPFLFVRTLFSRKLART